MNIDKKLLEEQIVTLSNQLNKDLIEIEREHIEGLLNMLGDIADSTTTLISEWMQYICDQNRKMSSSGS